MPKMIQKNGFFILRSQNQPIPKPNDSICHARGCVKHMSQFPHLRGGIQKPFLCFLIAEPTSIYTREPWVHAGKRSTITLHCQICFQRGKGIDSSHHGRVSQILVTFGYYLARKPKFRVREHTSCLCSTAALAVCFKGHMAGLDTTETVNEFSQLKY